MIRNKTELVQEIETVVENQIIGDIMFYMTEYRDIADYYFIADVFSHKCKYLALKIANEFTDADEEDE